jgi:hypothetical protein
MRPYVRLVDTEKAQHRNSRGHFFAAAAEAMRRILNVGPGTGPLGVAAVTNLSIMSGPGGGNIDLSQLVTGTLPNFQRGQIQGNGVTTLIAPSSQSNTWYLTGQNQSNLNGTAQYNILNQFTGVSGGIAFQGVQNITGGGQRQVHLRLGRRPRDRRQ